MGVLLVLLSALLYNSLEGWPRISKLGTGTLSPHYPGTGVAIDHATYKCDQNYTVEILSIDPLAIYLNNFLNVAETRYLLALGYVIRRHPSENTTYCESRPSLTNFSENM